MIGGFGMDRKLAPKGVDVRQEDYSNVSGLVDEWFEDGELDGVDKLDIGEGDVRIVNFVKRQRIGFYLSNGKSFAVPELMLKGKISGALYQRLVAMFGIETSTETKTPILIKSNVSLYKRLEQIGFTVVRPLLEKLASSLDVGVEGGKQDNLDYLIGYFYNEAIRTQGLSRIELKLNKNTRYYQNKAAKLAHLQDGVGEWDLVDLRYVIDGYTCCTLGHRIKWEFIVEERTTGERLSFGSTCIDDFFLVDSGIKGQVAKYKTYILNKLLEYAMQYDMGTMDNINVDRWVSAFGMYLRGHSEEVDYYLEYINSFVGRGMLIPISLQRKYLEAIDNSVVLTQLGSYVMSVHTRSDLGDVTRVLDVLVMLGYAGNLEKYKGNKNYEIEKGCTDKMNLYGLRVENTHSIDLLRRASSFLLEEGSDVTYKEVLKLLRSCETFDNYVNLLNNLVEVGEGLPKVLGRLGWFVKPDNTKDDKSLFGVKVTFTGGYKNTTRLVFAMNDYTLNDIFNVNKVLEFKLSVSKLPYEEDRNTIALLSKLFSKKNLDYNFNKSVSIYKRDYGQKLELLLREVRYSKVDGTNIYLRDFIDGNYSGCLKGDVVQAFLEEHGKITLEDLQNKEVEKERVEAAKHYHERGMVENAYTNTDDGVLEQINSPHKTEDGRWSPRNVDLNELTKDDFIKAAVDAADDYRMAQLPVELLRLLQQFVVEGGPDGVFKPLEKEFGYKVVKSCLDYNKCSSKQLAYIKRFSKQIALVAKPYYKKGYKLIDIFLEVWFD